MSHLIYNRKTSQITCTEKISRMKVTIFIHGTSILLSIFMIDMFFSICHMGDVLLLLSTILYALQFIYLFGVLRCFQHCSGHITTDKQEGQKKSVHRVLYCKLPTNGKQIPAFPLGAMPGIEPRPQRWEGRVLPLCHHGLCMLYKFNKFIFNAEVLKRLLYLQGCQ